MIARNERTANDGLIAWLRQRAKEASGSGRYINLSAEKLTEIADALAAKPVSNKRAQKGDCMIDRNARTTNRNKAIALAALVAALAALLAWGRGCRADSLPAPLEGLLARLEVPGTPQWKRDLVPRIRERRIERFTANTTCYCPFSRQTGQGCVWRDGRWFPIDPPAGGLFARNGERLRDGHCAVDRDTIPLGSVLYIVGIDQVLRAVDTGGAINGNDVDVCVIEVEAYLALAKRFSNTAATCWVLRRGKGQAQ